MEGPLHKYTLRHGTNIYHNEDFDLFVFCNSTKMKKGQKNATKYLPKDILENKLIKTCISIGSKKPNASAHAIAKLSNSWFEEKTC